MILKDNNSGGKKLISQIFKFLKLKKIWLVSLSLSFIFIYSASLVLLGGHFFKSGFLGRLNKTVTSFKYNEFNLPFNYLKGLSASPQTITLDIKHKDFQKLAYKRYEALKKNILITSSEDFVPAKIRFKDKTHKINIRLKGDWTDHLYQDKWSYRVKLKKENTLFGMKQFSLQAPKTRNYIYEWVFHQLLKNEDIINLRYDFMTLVVNGKNMGIYAVEEHFEKRLIEHNKRREGPILKFNEDLMWRDRARGFGRDDIAFFTSGVDGFKLGKTLSSPVLKKQFLHANNLIEKFLRGNLPLDQVLDLKRWATYFAILDVLNADHGSHFHNLRMYYNPITALLEPIGFDAQPSDRSVIDSVLGERNKNRENNYYFFEKKIFEDKNFSQEYHRQLSRMSEKSYLDEFFSSVEPQLNEKLSILYSDYPFYYFNKNLFYENQKVIKKILSPVKGLQSYLLDSDSSKISLQIAASQFLPLEVMRLETKDENQVRSIFPKKKIIIPGLNKDSLPSYTTVNFSSNSEFLKNLKDNGIKIVYRLLGSEETIKDDVVLFPKMIPGFTPNPHHGYKNTTKDFNFIKYSKNKKEFFIKKGNWQIKSDIVVPKGHKFIIDNGTTIDLLNGSKIVSYSPVTFSGTDKKPVVIKSSDHSGQGLFVSSSNSPSLLRYVHFKNLKFPNNKWWNITGAVSFYESDVSIENCKFSNNDSEDSLNIVRSKFVIKDSLFEYTKSDAFDSDFSDGDIISSRFENVGNDAIDISGSKISVKNVVIHKTGDKGISVGENSQMKGSDIKIEKATSIAIASKDLSTFEGENIKISDSKVLLSAFQKKPEFGPGTIIISKLDFKDNVESYLIEENSTVIVNGSTLSSNASKLKKELY